MREMSPKQRKLHLPVHKFYFTRYLFHPRHAQSSIGEKRRPLHFPFRQIFRRKLLLLYSLPCMPDVGITDNKKRRTPNIFDALFERGATFPSQLPSVSSSSGIIFKRRNNGITETEASCDISRNITTLFSGLATAAKCGLDK